MASQERIPYMTLYAKYRNSASLRGAAVLGDDDLMKRYVKWYSSVLSNEQLKDIVNENNDELDDEDEGWNRFSAFVQWRRGEWKAGGGEFT